MISSNRTSVIVSDRLKHGNKVVSFTSIKSIMNKSRKGSSKIILIQDGIKSD